MWEKSMEEKLRKAFKTLTKKLRSSLMRSIKNKRNLSNEDLVEEMVIEIEKKLYEFLGVIIKWTKKKK